MRGKGARRTTTHHRVFRFQRQKQERLTPSPPHYTTPMSNAPLVGIIMGSKSDWPTMRAAAEALAEANVPYEARVVSAHRTPDLMAEYAKAAAGRGLRCIVAGAGGAAHLPGMVAAFTTVPVIGVPVRSQ